MGVALPPRKGKRIHFCRSKAAATGRTEQCPALAAAFLLTTKVKRPKLALTAGAGLLMSAAVEEKDASSQSFFEKAPRKSHRRD